MVLLHIITLVIPNFHPFESISYRFGDNFFEIIVKSAIFAKFCKIIKFSKYRALTYYNPCDHKFFAHFALCLTISEIRTFFEKMAKSSIFVNCAKL